MTEFDPAGNPIPENYLLIDFDGTLIDSLSALYGIYLEFLQKHGRTGSKEEFEFVKGPSIAEVVKILKDRHKLKESEGALLKEYNGLLQQNYVSNVQIYPHAIEALEYARNLGFKTAIVTSASKDLVNSILDKHHLSDLIDHLITAMPKEKGKPHPDIYFRALKELKIEPLDAVVIEDSLNGALASLCANIPTLVLNPTGETLERLKKNANKDNFLVINDWQDVIAFIEDLADVTDEDFVE